MIVSQTGLWRRIQILAPPLQWAVFCLIQRSPDVPRCSDQWCLGLVELYAAILVLRFWRRHLEGRRIILFVDSWPALDSLVKGDSSVRLWRELLLVLENPEERLPMFLWFARVPSKSNVADPPSRGSSDELAVWKLTVERPVCPLCKKMLSSLV